MATGTVGRQRGRRTLERGTSVLFAAARDLQLAELAGVVVHAGTSMESTSRKLRDLNSADLAGRIRGLCMAPLPGPRPQESGETEAEAVERLVPSVDGVILATTRLGDDAIRAIAERKPVVLINRAVRGLDGILPDVDRGVTELMNHLHSLGHRSIVYLAGPETSWVSSRRWERLLEASESLGIALVEIGPNAPTIEGGRDALRRVFAARPSAVIAFNDLIAIGLMQAAAQRGVKVPDDLSVAGFDDIFGSELISPPLTTVRSELETAGKRSVRTLLARLGGDDAGIETGLLATTLIIRESTGQPRQA